MRVWFFGIGAHIPKLLLYIVFLLLLLLIEANNVLFNALRAEAV